jgi:hypothetical protein
MSKCTTVEIEHRTGSEVEHIVCLAPKKNHGAMMQLNQQFGEDEAWSEMLFYRDPKHKAEAATNIKDNKRSTLVILEYII